MKPPPTMDRDALWAALESSGAKLEPGLTEDELDSIEARFGFTFPPDLAMMLSLALPVERDDYPYQARWIDWRNAAEADLQDRVGRPVDDVLACVAGGHFWLPQWGPQPSTRSASLARARAVMATAPRLVPVHSHRYIPSTPDQPGNPVLSVHEVDIVYYGTDLLDYFNEQFGSKKPYRSRLPAEYASVDVWTDIIKG